MLDILMQLLSVKESDINPDSPGAKRWIWIDRGEIKISARLFAKFGAFIAILLFFSIFSVVSVFQGGAAWYDYLGLGYLVLFVSSFTFLIVYNRIVKARRAPDKNTEKLPEELPSPEPNEESE